MKRVMESYCRFYESANDEARRDVARFTCTEPEAPRRWFAGYSQPEGLKLLRLRYFLELCGYEIPEFVSLPSSLHTVGRALAFRVISEDGLRSELRLLHNRDFLRYFLPGFGISAERRKLLDDLAARLQDALRTRVDVYIEELSPMLRKRIRERHVKDVSGKYSLSPDEDKLVSHFVEACDHVREYGDQILKGSASVRHAIRRIMTNENPHLHLTREVLTQLICEQRVKDQFTNGGISAAKTKERVSK